ncbi:MAG: sigma-54 dependent transcriptional regulator [Candidatus Palauibacterales bacterium]|nr:sigma-54 dependent transcriptional regulator [Candidatus Palauibacterales bacterium]MDP2530885.1 sigma-54 dependent transcriptional regulator [Candidatus Palauibacterales bacterium]MDP2582792.1 sigma-54 dependent transcriptional regulator [Candidatus Palauibacterales bacterium]
MTRVLVVDDVPAVAEQYAYDLRRLGEFRTLVATGGREALELLASEAVDCVVLDLEMPGVDGFDVLTALARQGRDVPVIVYTGTGDYERCARAIRLGAYGFIDKAEPVRRVVQEIRGALERGRLAAEVERLRDRLDDDAGLLGTSGAMLELKERIARLAPIPSPVLVLGESGTGKELVARRLHDLGRAGGTPFVAVNGAALPENLVESELFGHEKGAFTGADRLRVGAFEAADRGTLFLDEVGELTPATQAKLLRVLEQRELTRVGGTRTVEVECRVVAATHRDLERDVADGRFRDDLYYRLNAHVLRVPPLRERLSDVPLLADHFLAVTCERFGVAARKLGPEAADRLCAYEWRRNNVRELRNVVERMVIAGDGPVVRAEDVPADLRAGVEESGGDLLPVHPEGLTYQALKEEAERRIVLGALRRHDGHVTETARALGLADHASLLKIMRRLGIERG